jgi:hypothetical protein
VIPIIIGLLVACSTNELQRVSGAIQELQMDGGSLKSITIIESSGSEATFEIANPHQINVVVDHLRFHQQVGEPISLLLIPRDGRLLVASIDDCPC